jgi:hypothetical protein
MSTLSKETQPEPTLEWVTGVDTTTDSISLVKNSTLSSLQRNTSMRRRNTNGLTEPGITDGDMDA